MVAFGGQIPISYQIWKYIRKHKKITIAIILSIKLHFMYKPI